MKSPSGASQATGTAGGYDFYLVVIWKALTQNCPKVRAIINVYSKIFNDIRYLLLEELLLWLRLKKATRLYALVGIPNQMELR